MSKSENATKLGAVLVALGASACCWLPLLLVGLGAGAAGVGAVFESLRPYLMVATVILLGTAFYTTYRRKTVCATNGACATRGSSAKPKALLWGITAVAAVSFAFPYWSALRLADANASESSLGNPAIEMPVRGMTCAACAVAIHHAVMAVPGVRAARVEQTPGRLLVWTEGGKVAAAAVAAAVKEAGYEPGAPITRQASAEPATRTAYIEVKGMVQKLGIT